MSAVWQWEKQSRVYGNYGNANQWTVNAGLASLARESAQNSNDARPPGETADMVFTFSRLTGDARTEFENAIGWAPQLRPHLDAMAKASTGAVAAGQIKAGLQAWDDSEALILLRIADYGCKGLSGPEFPEHGLDPDDFGNLIKLCRLDLYSGKDQGAGGSFGLGKAVYWRFSRIQTVLFNSRLAEEDAVDGRFTSRLVGVNQGVMHAIEQAGYEGRGYFGVPDGRDDVASVWDADDLVRRLRLDREDTRPGTSALLIGFYDPDQPERGTAGAKGLIDIATDLRRGIEENFWPMLSRGRMNVRLEVKENDVLAWKADVDPEETFTELVRALRRFDNGEEDSALEGPYSMVTRDVPIRISARTTDDPHEPFTHTAKLVVTLSDEVQDSLENKVCLLRRPEMVVQTVDKAYEDRTYHAFLLAGVAINPLDPTLDQERADNFLRYAEPPAHDRWIPGTGRGQTSQANLTAHYKAPWLENLRKIESRVRDALLELFGAPPPAGDRPPEAIFKHLNFLRGDTGKGGAGGGVPRRPRVEVVDGTVVDGRWNVTFEVAARNDPDGWSIEPQLCFVGLDGTNTRVGWESLQVVDGGTVVDGRLLMASDSRRRTLKATVKGVSVGNLPIPPDEAAVTVVLRSAEPATVTSGAIKP